MTRAMTRTVATGLQLEHQCPACGAWYRPTRRDQVYCDRACKQAGHRQRKKLRPVPRETDPYVA